MMPAPSTGPSSYARPVLPAVDGHRWISERRTFKVLLEPEGGILAVTMKTYSYLLIVSRRFVGVKKIRTRDRVVARAGYSTPRVISLIDELYPEGP
jgi:hypothetical protein